MTGLEFAKVLLYAYPRMNGMVEEYGQEIERGAMLSFRHRESGLALAERLAEKIMLKRFLYTVKCDLDGLLSGLKKEELFLLEYKYFRRRAIAEKLFRELSVRWSPRTFYRKQIAVLKKVCAELTSRGMTQEWFLREFSHFPNFMRAYRAILSGKEYLVAGKPTVQKSSSSPSQRGVDFLPRMTKTATATAAAHRAHRKNTCAPESEGVASVG